MTIKNGMYTTIKKSNIYIFLNSIFQFQGFIGPILFVFYTKHMGLTVSEYLFSDSLLFIIMALCEVPSGIIADFIGRKIVFTISQVAICIGMLMLILVPSFKGAIIVAIIYGVFGALRSGVSESILYETYERVNKLKDYEYIRSKSISLSFVVSIIFSILSGYIVEYNLILPIVLDLLMCIFILILTILLLEDDKEYNQKKKLLIPSKEEVDNVINIMIIASILFSCSRVIFSFFQPLLIESKFKVVFLGYASALYSIVSAVSSFFYKKIRNNISSRNFFKLILILQIISTIGIALIDGCLLIVFILIQQVQRGIVGPFMYMEVNSYIDSQKNKRVSLMSLMYFLIGILTAISFYITSIISKKYGLRTSVVIYVVVINAILTVSLVSFFKNKNIEKYR